MLPLAPGSGPQHISGEVGARGESGAFFSFSIGYEA